MKLRAVDRVLLAYAAVTTIVGLLRLRTSPGAIWVLVANALLVFLVVLVNRPGQGRFASALAEIYPLLLIPLLYGALDLLAGHGGIVTHDATVQQWELRIFGSQISREWWQRAPSRLWSSVLHTAYFAYYVVVPAGPLWFLYKGDLPNLRRAVLSITTVFVVCYLGFLFYPVAGPYYEFARPSAQFLDNGPARLVYALLARASSYGAAFPSSHVAATLAATVATARGAPRLGACLAVPSVLLTVGVVYCQMHYAVDAVAGVGVAALIAAALWRSGYGIREISPGGMKREEGG